jgi:hypothetical protein
MVEHFVTSAGVKYIVCPGKCVYPKTKRIPFGPEDGPWSGSCVLDVTGNSGVPDHISVYRATDETGTSDDLNVRIWFNTSTTDELVVPPAFNTPEQVSVLVYLPVRAGPHAIGDTPSCFRGVRGATVHAETSMRVPWWFTRVENAQGQRLFAMSMTSPGGQGEPDLGLTLEMLTHAAIDMQVPPLHS